MIECFRKASLFVVTVAIGSVSTLVFARGGTAQAGSIIYVDDDAPAAGDGLGWATAYRFLHDAIDAAGDAAELRIGQGVYRPDRSEIWPLGSGVRSTTFALRDGMTLAGGYAGFGAPDPDERVIGVFETILSGDLDGNDGPDFANYEDNSAHVVTAEDVTDATLDGVTVRAGHANLNHPNDSGAGAFLINANVTVRDCLFVENLASTGSALWADESSTSTTSCRFEDNRANVGGGAIWATDGTMTVDACSFQRNEATTAFGGAIATSALTCVLDCAFIGNTAARGGALATLSGLSVSITIERGFFLDNSAGADGGVLNLDDEATTMISDCDFQDNHAGDDGGVVWLERGSCTFTDCRFTGNTSVREGAVTFALNEAKLNLVDCEFDGNDGRGIIYNDSLGGGVIASYRGCTFRNNQALVAWENDSSFEMIDCLFEDNESALSYVGESWTARISGCVFRRHSNLAVNLQGPANVIDCDFIDNTREDFDGSALRVRGPRDTTFIGCRFLGNAAPDRGGAVTAEGSSRPVFANCIFGGNSAHTGGAVAVNSSTATFANCTLFANQDGLESGGILVFNDATAHVINSILWRNDTDGRVDEDAQLYVDPDSILTVDYSIVQGWTGALGGRGNLDADPQFVDLDGADDVIGTVDDDVRLLPGSPGIDAGDNWGLPTDALDVDGDGTTCEMLPYDADDTPRFADTPATVDTGCGNAVVVDMGAYEHAGKPQSVVWADVDGDGEVTILDMLLVLANWGESPDDCRADLLVDGAVNLQDLLAILAAWGACPPA